MYELGTGVLNWDSVERQTDRYGSVYLLPDTDSNKRLQLAQVIPEGIRGRLIAVVKETRKSRHVGDLFHKVYPQTPAMGERIVLGEGRLFSNRDEVSLRPDDGRVTLWLDIHALYKVHEQTVTLYFEELPSC